MRPHPLTASFLAFCLGAASPAQNVLPMSRLDNRTGYTGVYGYRAPDGREFALVGEQNGVQIVDTSDPFRPVEIAYFTAPTSLWREYSTYGTYVYSVSEQHGGLRVIDMADPAQPRDLGLVNDGRLGWYHAHTISQDADTGFLFVHGTDVGTVILDPTASPQHPIVRGTWTVQYSHDGWFRRGRGYFAEILNQTLRIVDTRQAPTLIQRAVVTTPLSLTHNVWVTDDDVVALVTHEEQGGFVQLYDVSNVNTPAVKGRYAVPNTTVHMATGIGRTAHFASYADGYHMVDVSDMNNPRPLARYDTTAATGTGYIGAWGVYPWQDSGVVYVTDMTEGLYCLLPTCGHLARFGQGVAGHGRRVPRAEPTGSSPMVGASRFGLKISQARPDSGFILLVGSVATTPFLGVDLYVDVHRPHVQIFGSTDAAGNAVQSLPIDNDPAYANQVVFCQVLVLDPDAPQGLAASRGMWFGICP